MKISNRYANAAFLWVVGIALCILFMLALFFSMSIMVGDIEASELDWDDDRIMDQLYELDSELRADLNHLDPDDGRMRVVIPGDFEEPILIWHADDDTTIIQQGDRTRVCIRYEDINVCQ